MAYEYIGIVEEDLGERTVGTKGFLMHEIVLGESRDIETKYPRHIKFVFKGKYTDEAKMLNIGDEVKIRFGIDGRIWDSPQKGRMYFTELIGLKCEVINKAANPVSAASHVPDDESVEEDGEMEEMPF